MKYLLAILALATISFAGVIFAAQNDYFTAQSIQPTITPAPLDSDKLWSLIQDWRKSEGLQPYIKDQRLCEIARDRADDEKLDNHKGFLEKYSSYPYVIQENLVNAPAEDVALLSWTHSPSHLATLKKPYTHSCVVTNGFYAVQIFSSF